jgi:hypothetical protein
MKPSPSPTPSTPNNEPARSGQVHGALALMQEAVDNMMVQGAMSALNKVGPPDCWLAGRLVQLVGCLHNVDITPAPTSA